MPPAGPGQCPGSRMFADESATSARRAECPVCGGIVVRTTSGRLRAHPPAVTYQASLLDLEGQAQQ